MADLMTPAPKEPLLNIPPLTLWLGLILAICFAALQNEVWQDHAVRLFAFIPQAFSHAPLALSYSLLSYVCLHFGWPHILMNITGLLAFGSGTENLLGRRHFIALFIGGAILGALGHWALFPQGENPLGGASAGISAFFGAVLPLLVRRRQLVVAAMVFLTTNLVFGLMGMPGQPGLAIAWQAHIVGFLFGLGYVALLLRYRPKASGATPRHAE